MLRGHASLIGLVLLCACTVGPNFSRPEVRAPSAWWGRMVGRQATRPTTDEAVDVDWWRSFDDPELSSLVERLARQNLTLQQAAEQVEQAQAERRVAASGALPNLNATGSYDRVRIAPALLEGLVEPSPSGTPSFDLFIDSLSASWQLDLFGRVRRAVEARTADVAVRIEALHAVALMAISELAQDYMELRETQAARAIAEENADDARRTARLVQRRFDAGIGSTLDTQNALEQASAIEATIPPLEASEARLIDAIGLLLSEPPRALETELSPAHAQPIVPPTVPIGLPAQLARRRPDILQAEARLHAATAETGVAVADFYPDITLTGAVGTQALQLPQAFNAASGDYLFGPSIEIPIFEGGRLRATLRLRRSQQREAALAYRDTVLRAWQDVDVALETFAAAQRRQEKTAEAVHHSRAALEAARARFALGATDFLNVLIAQRTLLDDETTLAQNTMAVENGLVSLYRALGGGWQIAN